MPLHTTLSGAVTHQAAINHHAVHQPNRREIRRAWATVEYLLACHLTPEEQAEVEKTLDVLRRVLRP
jgi:hypothetical protein